MALACLVTAGSCAYFNTLYNARRLYREAEERRESGGAERELRDRYTQVVTKCATIVRDYPDSRWVDDALFLMGKALVRQGESEKGIRKFIELTTNFPKSEYLPPSLYWLGLAYYEKGEYNRAIVYTDRFLKEYPKHDLRYEVIFLAGDISRGLEKDDEALAFYSRVAEEASSRDVIDEATLKTAELFYSKEEWEKAASAYERILRKGIPWNQRYEVSVALGYCNTRIGRCREALDVFDRLLEESVSLKEKPRILLGRAAGFLCMDSLQTALSIYGGITKEFPRSTYSAEAFYRMGVIYHERLDSLAAAQKAFSKVSGEFANSEYAAIALEKSGSLRRLMELEGTSAGGATADKLAEKRFLAAEIQLMRLREVDLALSNYRAVVDSFPTAKYAPRAAFAIAWIYHHEKQDLEKALDMYRNVVSTYPRSQQALGAIDEIGDLGAEELKARMEAYIDSAQVDTSAVTEAVDTIGVLSAPPDSAAAQPVDTIAVPMAPTDSASAVPESMEGHVPADTIPPAAPPSRPKRRVTPIADAASPAVQPADTIPPAAPADSTESRGEEAD
jgi:TolA-binding protein